MKHTMESVMRAVLVSRADGKALPVLTSNQCYSLAQSLNAACKERADFDEWYASTQGTLGHGDKYKHCLEAWMARSSLEAQK